MFVIVLGTNMLFNPIEFTRHGSGLNTKYLQFKSTMLVKKESHVFHKSFFPLYEANFTQPLRLLSYDDLVFYILCG